MSQLLQTSDIQQRVMEKIIIGSAIAENVNGLTVVRNQNERKRNARRFGETLLRAQRT